jgi:hypothetical protein
MMETWEKKQKGDQRKKDFPKPTQDRFCKVLQGLSSNLLGKCRASCVFAIIIAVENHHFGDRLYLS